MEGFAHEDEVRLKAVCEFPQLPQVIRGEAVGHVQPQPIDIELLHPGADGVELAAHHVRVAQVQLHQLVVALPGLVPEAVVIAGIAAEIDAEPVLVGAVPLLLLHVPEGPEAPAHVVEHAVQHHPQPGLVEGAADLLEVLAGPQAAVQPGIVPGVVAVLVAVKDGIEEDRVRPRLLDMVDPVQYPQDTALLHAVVVLRRAAQAQGIDLVDYRFVKPHSVVSLSRLGFAVSPEGTGRPPPGRRRRRRPSWPG